LGKFEKESRKKTEMASKMINQLIKFITEDGEMMNEQFNNLHNIDNEEKKSIIGNIDIR
jgi:hypothetical protein